MVERAENQAAPYFEFLRVPQLSCGIYTLSAGAADTQSAHDEDEVYFVLRGRAKMEFDGDKKELGPGSILYVPADTDHAFVEIEEDLSLLVFFGSGGPSGAQI
ncbi:MAG: cupin domain-containing protein [bacterium]|nr:cupin [Deltaproteobacteria bacterium]MCP4908607.1 cupin domain-containing protein [bacterium]